MSPEEFASVIASSVGAGVGSTEKAASGVGAGALTSVFVFDEPFSIYQPIPPAATDRKSSALKPPKTANVFPFDFTGCG